jgi:hypothetical protein
VGQQNKLDATDQRVDVYLAREPPRIDDADRTQLSHVRTGCARCDAELCRKGTHGHGPPLDE